LISPTRLVLCTPVLVLLLWCHSGYAATINAASCSSTDVQTALNATSSGDTVAIPAGTCTWTTTVTPPCHSWTLQGSGTGSTNITVNNSSGDAISVNGCSGGSIRVTGISFNTSAVGSGGVIFIFGGSGLSFRIDHNTFQSSTSWGRWLWDNVPCVSPGCVIDHNTITNQGALIAAETPGDTDNLAGIAMWSKPMVIDNGSEVYFENNSFTFNNYFANDMMDCDNGGRYVFRYNTVVGNVVFDHGYDSVAESCLELTAYQNNLNGAYNGTNEAQADILYRGGTGVVYQNIMKNSTQANFLVTNYRSNGSGSDIIASNLPYCGGGNSKDGNVTNGWPCYEQIGRGSSPTTPGQASYPLYEWDNCKTALGCTGTSDQNTITAYNNIGGTPDYTVADIVKNRDFYDSQSTGCTGTQSTGVCIGLLSARAGNCTAGVAYWATDSNTLYKCSSTNTWAVYYQPYTYPHPLQGASSAAPAPPVNVTTTVN